MPGLNADHQALNLLAGLAAVIAVVYALDTLYAMREGIRHKLRLVIRSYAVFVLGLFLLPQAGASMNEAFLGGLLIAVIVMLIAPRRSRYIPAKVRRQVIARDLKGDRYDPKKHHLDHIVPFSKGGSHTADNLRVIPRKKNLQKGARMPRWTEWF